MKTGSMTLFSTMRKHFAFRGLGLGLSFLQVLTMPILSVANAQQITPDGRSDTSLTVNGNVTDIYTNTRYGNTGLNSFSVFNVYQGNEVNLFLPTQTDNLVNMVTDQQTVIDGMLSAYKDGKIGGNVYFLNPHGVVVGRSGVVNVGRLSMVTPTFRFMDSMFGPGNVISAPSIRAVLDNEMPISRSGLIDVRGQINAPSGSNLQAGNLSVSGGVQSGARAVVAIDSLVNLSPSISQTSIVSLDGVVVPDSKLAALDDMIITGDVSADGHNGGDAGTIQLLAEGDITLGAGASVTANAANGGDAGSVVVMAQGTSTLRRGAAISADASGSGAGGFVEFSARDTVELAGGSLSANAENGRQGDILIDPQNIVISADLLRNDGANADGGASGGGTSWNAGSLTLQADDNITLSSNVTVSSRVVANAANATAHRNDSSTGASGNITLEAQNITLQQGSMLTAEGNNSFAGGTVLLDADSPERASITLDGATLRGGTVLLDADAVQSDVSVYANPTGVASATITLENNATITASDNASLSANALQDDPGYAGGILFQFDARRARSAIRLDNSSLTAGQNVIIDSAAEMQTDLSKQGWASLASLLPIDVAVAVTESSAAVDVTGTSSITATSGDVSIDAGADTRSTVYANSTSLGLGLVAGVSVTDNQANVNITDDVAISGADVSLRSRTRSQITAVGDASAAPIAGVSASLAAAVGILNDNTTTSVSGNAGITATGDIDVLADSEVSAIFAARATSDDDFSSTVNEKFDTGIDNTSQLDQEFLGYNLQDILKSGVSEVITQITEALSSDDEDDGNKFQLGGAMVYADVKNNTVAEVVANDEAGSTNAPTLTAGQAVDVAAQGVTQAQSFASGRTDNPTFGGQAGIGIQMVENRLRAEVSGANQADVSIAATDLTVRAESTSYSGDFDNQTRFGVFASSGVGGGGSDDDGGVGIAGAIALSINEVNDTQALIGDNSSLSITGDAALSAVNDTEVKATADGSSEAHQVADELFALMMDDNSSEAASDPDVSGGTLGIGASVAVATHKNTTRAEFASSAQFVGGDNPDSLSVTAEQTSSTETESKAAGAGSISIVPLASVTLARNSALATIASGSGTITTQGNITVSSQQTITSSAVGDGEATTSDSGNFAIGISAGVTIADDSNEASVYRNLNSNGGDISITATSRRIVRAGAKALSGVGEGGGDDSGGDADGNGDTSTDNATDNASNSTGEASEGISTLLAGFSSDSDDDESSYDFSEQMSQDTDALTDGADLGSIGGDGEDEDSTKITIAAAMGVTYAESVSKALIGDQVQLNAGVGAVSVETFSNTDMSADADASVSGGDYNIGGAVGLNIVQNDNKASIGSGANVTSGDVTVTAGMQSQLMEDNSTDDVNVIAADAVAGAGTGEFSLAGSVGLNLVMRNNTSAVISTDAQINASGDIAVNAEAKSQYKTDAKATVGIAKTIWEGIDETFSTLTDIKVWTEAAEKGFEGMLENLQASLTSGGGDDDGDGGDSGGDGDGGGDGGDEGGTGVGAGISVNIIVAEDTRAAIEDNATLGGPAAGTISVTASAESDIETNAFAGAKPDEAGGAAKTSLDAAVSIGVLLKDVDAYMGAGAGLTATDNVTVSASSQSNTLSTAKGEVSADSTAVGASVAVGVALETIDSELKRDVTTTGAVDVLASASSTDISLADAVAAGTVVDKYADKLGKTPDMLTQSTSQLGDVNNGPSSMEALKGGFTGGDGASFDLGGADAATGSTSGGEAQQSGSLNIAASVAVNWADHAARAKVADNVQIVAGDDVTIRATNDANYRTRGSGMSVFADKSIGVGVGLLKTGQQTHASLGDNVGITINGGSGDVEVAAVTSENQGVDEDGTSFRSYASSEGIAGAGGGELGIAGSLSLVVSLDSQSAKTGDNVQIVAPGDVDVRSSATNKIVNRAWAIAVASDVTCDNPGNCGGSGGDKTAVGASIAVNVVNDSNLAQIGESSSITAGDNAAVVAEDLASGAGDFTLDLQDENLSSEDFITTNYTATLQNSSYYAEAIAGGVAQGGNAGSGSLAVTVSVGSTQALVGEGVSIRAEDIDVRAYNESTARHLVGAVALSTDKKAVGASISGIYLREDVRSIVGDDGSNDDNATTTLTANSGDVDITAEADQDTLTFMAAGGVSGNDLALAGAFGFNVMDTDVEARVVENAVIQATAGSIGVNANSYTDITNVALAIAGSGGGNSVGGTLALNMFLADKKAIVGSSDTADNNISLNAAQAVNIGVNAKQEIINGILSASVSTSSNAISGALTANVIEGDSYALANRGANINDNTTLASAAASQSVSVTAEDNTTITDLTGTIAASSSTSVGVALGGNVFWKDVKAGINSAVVADNNINVTADTSQNLTSFVVGIAASTGGTAGAGSLGLGLIKSTTKAEIGEYADLYTSGSVKLHAGDDTDIFMMEPAASFSAGGVALAGAVGAAVFLGETKAQVKDGASVTALGQTSMQVEIETTRTSSPLLDGIMGGDDNQTRDSLGSFNDDFTFDNVKDLFLTERRDTETRRGLAVTAVADQDVISIAASGAVSSDSAIAVSLSAGVGIGSVEASIGDADINVSNSGAHADQDVVVRAVSDTYWTDVSGAIAVGTGSAGVGIGADVVVQTKDTRAFIARGADVTANDDVIVHAYNNDRVINSALSVGGGSTAGVSGAAAVGVTVNTTKAYVDGEVTAGDDLTILAGAKSEHIQIAGGIGAGGTAGIGASFGIGFAKNDTQAFIDENGITNAGDNTTVKADTVENAVSAVIAGGVGGTVGVSVSLGVKVHQSNTQAFIKGQANQDSSLASASQSVDVIAANEINTIDVIGGIGGGGTVGVGVTLNALVVHNNAQAWIGGGPNTRVSAAGDINVRATSNKTTKNFLLAGAAGGTVAVGGNIAVLMVGAESDDETASQMDSDDHGDVAGASDDRTSAIRMSDIANDDNSSGDYDRTGFNFAELNAAIDDNNSAHSQLGSTFDATNSGLSRNKTQAFIENGAIVRAGDDLTIEAEDTSNTIFAAAAIGGSGVATVGATIGVLLVNNTAEAYIDDNAVVNVEDQLLVRSRTSELVGSGALSAGGAGVANVQGVVMAQKVSSKSRAFIDDATINDNTSEAASQSVSVQATSDTELVSFSGSGGGAIVGVGITGDVMILEKETKAYIDDDADVRSGGDVDVSAKAQADMIQIAVSINGGLVGVTGAAGVIAANNVTEARIGRRANVFARDSINVQATDDTEMDGIVITGAGGAVGVSGSVGTYVVESRTAAIIDADATVTALADGNGITALSGAVDNTSTQTRTQDSRDQEGGAEQRNIELVDASYGTRTANGVNVAAVSYEDINFAPIGVAGGAVGVAGVVATTVTNSTTEALVNQGAVLNGGDNSAASANQSVSLLAASEGQLNNISAGVGVGGVGVTFDIDTQVFKKNVRARMLGSATAKDDVTVKAESRDRVLQTAIGIAGGVVGVSGVVEVSVVNNDVLAEIGDNATALAGDDIRVNSDQNLSMIQTAGNVAAGASGVGASLGILIAKSSNTARIGNNTIIHASDNLSIAADTTTNLNQNIAGFAGGLTDAFSGSIGINILKTSTVAEIGSNASINQQAMDNASSQSVNVLATDIVTTQGAAGAAAIGGVSGIGIGVVTTVTRNTTRASIGNGSVISATDDVLVIADSTKNISNQGIAAAGGVGVGAAGSVAITLVGGSMSQDSRDTFDKQDDDGNSTGNLLADAETSATRDRSDGEDSSHNGNDASGSSNQLYADGYSDRADTLAETEASGLQSDMLSGSADSTLASIGSDVTVNTAGGEISVLAEETISLSQISGGAAIGSVGVGGFVAVADYGGSVGARIGDRTVIDNASALTVDATLNSGNDVNINLPGGSNVNVSAVNSTVIGAAVGLVGVSASIANVNLSENVTAEIGDDVTVTLTDNSSAVTIDALRDVDADVRVAAVAGGLAAAGISYAGVASSGNALAQIGTNSVIGSNNARTGDVLIRARNSSTQEALAVSAGLAYAGALVGAVVDMSDTGTTTANIGSGAQIYSSGAIELLADDKARNSSEARGVAVAAGIGLSVISSDIDVDRDAEVRVGNNAILTADNISMTATFADGSNYIADAEVLGASGGLLAGVSGSENFVDVDTNARVAVGSNTALNVNTMDNGTEGDGSTLNVLADNAARLRGRSDGFAIGAAALGAHVGRVGQTGGTQINFGAGGQLNIRGDMEVTSQSSRRATMDLVAGAGGLLAINGGESDARSTATNSIIFADAANTASGTVVNVTGGLNILAANNDNYDSKIDASSIGLAGVTGGLASATGAANVDIRLGNYSDITSHQLNVVTNNRLGKTGISGDNFNFSGGGGLSAAVGFSEATQIQNSRIRFGENASAFVTGDFGDEGLANIRALSLNKMDTKAKVSTGAVVSVPRALARNTVTSTNSISFENGAMLATERGNINIKTSADADIDSVAKTSVWGLAGVGAGAQAYATLTSNETINLARNSVVRANGYLNTFAGQDQWLANIDVNAKADIFNKTLVAINAGLNADAVVNRNVRLNVGTGAGLQSAQKMDLRAMKGTMVVAGAGRNQYTVLGVPVEDSFGSETIIGGGEIIVDGRVETGIFNEQYIGFGRDFTNFDIANNGTTYRRPINKIGGEWYLDDGTQLVVSEGSYSSQLLDNIRSGDNVKWTILKDQNLANDIQDEIDALNDAKAAAGNPDAFAALDARRTSLQTQRTDALGMSNAGTSISAEIATQQGISQTAQTLRDACDENVNPGCTANYQTTIDEADGKVADLQNSQASISTEVGDDVDPSATIAILDQEIAAIQAQISDLSDSATASNIDTEIAFLVAMRDNLNTGAVDIIEVGNLFGATGHVEVKADTLSGSSAGTLHSEHEVNITVRNDSPNPMRIKNIEIPNQPGGNIYFNEQLINNAADIRHINKDKSAIVDMALSMSPNNFTTNVNIISRFDPYSSSYNPTVNGHTLNAVAPEIMLAGTIENRGGAVSVNNRHGSIHQFGQINASEVSITAGGALFVNDKTPGIFQYGPHPESMNGFGVIASTRLDDIGISDADAGGCRYAPGNLRLDRNNDESCTEGNLSNTQTLQASEDNGSIIAGKVFIVANTINLNSVIQSGIAQKDITINANHSEFSLTDGSTQSILNNDRQFISGRTGSSREGEGGIFAYYNSADDVVEINGLEAKGGDVTIAGKLISTGHGQINVLDGYGTYNVTNNSSKDVRLNFASTGEIEGKVTLIDNAKDNGHGDPLVTQYTRTGNTINVMSNQGINGATPSNAVGGLDGTIGRLTHYDPLANQRYFWIQAEELGVERNFRADKSAWETFGIGHSYTSSYSPPTSTFTGATALPASALPMADYAAVDTSTNAEYRLRPKFIQESFTRNTTIQNRRCRGIPWLVNKCWWTNNTNERETGTMFYFQDVKADKRVNVKFIGSDTGNLNVTSAAGIQINGNIKAAGSNVNLTATGGNIVVTNANADLTFGNLTLNASGSIGTISNPITMIQENANTIDATAGSGVHLRTETGTMRFADLANTSGDVSLYAGQDIITNTGSGGTAIAGDNITMTAVYGSITEAGGGTINVDTNNQGSLNVRSRAGNLDITEVAGNLHLGTVDAIGDVSLTTLSGSIIDANDVQTDDLTTQAELLNLWQDLKLRGNDAEQKRTAQIASYNSEMTDLYGDYWRLRDVQQTPDGQYIAQDYDPNFSYSATADERQAMNNDPTRIAAYEASQQARYQQAYEKFGDPNYDPNYTHVASMDETDEFTAGYFWSDHELEVPLPGVAFKETTDTTAYIEEANIIGDNINLNVSGNIGEYQTLGSFDIADVISGDNLTSSDKIILTAAESDDVSFDNMDALTAQPELDGNGDPLPAAPLTGTLTVTQREDIDIEARNSSSVININAPAGYAFIGGENSNNGLNINTLAAGGEVRLKVNGDLNNARSDSAAVLSGRNAVIESGDGVIGSSATPFRVDIADTYKMTARALGGIWLEELTNDIRIGQVYSPAQVNLTSPGAMFDAENDLIVDVKGDVVRLTAAANIGEQYLNTDSSLIKKQKALDVASADYNTSQFELTSTGGGAWLYGPLGQNLRLTSADLTDELDVAVGANLRVQGTLDTDGNDVTLRSYETLHIDGDGGVNTMGALLTLAAVEDVNISSTLDTQNGDMLAIGRNVSILEDAALNMGTGALRINAQDNASITGITSSNNASCAASQTGCAVTILATNIQDGGDVSADINLLGNGGLRLGAHQYVNVNDVQHSGSSPLQLEIGGKNNGARGVAAMVSVTTNEDVNLAYLSMNSAVIEAPRTGIAIGGSRFTVDDGNIRDNLYLNLGSDDEELFMARIGRLEDNALSPDSWLLAGGQTGYFDTGAVEAALERSDDYRCTGLPSYIGNANAIFDFSFSFQRPFVDCTGVLNYYSPAYSLLNPEQTADQQVLGQVVGVLQQLNRNSRQVGITGGLTPEASSNFLATVATRGLRDQQRSLRGGFADETQGPIGISSREGPTTQPIGILLQQGLSVSQPEATIDLEALEEAGEAESAEADGQEVLIQQSSLEGLLAPAS